MHPLAIKGLVEVLTEGAKKYAPRNWELGMPWSTVLASLKRHLAAIEAGEDFDPEDGKLHIDHLQCNAHFLSAYYRIYPQGDDRQHTYLNHPRIGLDIDEVLAAWVPSWCDYWGMQEPQSWYFDRHILKKFEQMEADGVLDQFYLDLKPLVDPNTIPFEPHCYVTSRPVATYITEEWLDKFGFPTRPVHTVGVGQSKVEVLKKAGVEIFVDDRFDNFVELNKNGVCCFLWDAPHNRRYDVGYKRIKSFKELPL
jgi:5'(3')-deoxyribonucleotidase